MLGFSLNRVEGESMAPLIPHGSYMLFHPFFRKQKLALGTLVKVNHPKYGTIIKSISYIDSNGLYWLAGANEQSVSTLEMGPIKPQMIIGKACFLAKPALQHTT